jgi:hypothetical protein
LPPSSGVAVAVDQRAPAALRIDGHRSRLVGTGVVGIGKAVAVVVGIRTAIAILEAVLVLGLVGALVQLVDDAVPVAIRTTARLRIRAASAGLVGAGVRFVRDAVVVVVVVGTAVVVLEAVQVFLLGRAFVLSVRNAVVVVVPVGAPVAVLEAVSVFSELRALVQLVHDSVVVHVVLARRPLHSAGHAQGRAAKRVGERRLDPEHDRRIDANGHPGRQPGEHR